MKLDNLGPDVFGVLLLGAEGLAETENCDWLRDSTQEEARAFYSAWIELQVKKGIALDEVVPLSIVDPTGRPYWMTTVLSTAPDWAKAAAEAAKRVRLSH